MNGVDLVGIVVLALFALRGYWRGFLRESCGLLALLGGLSAAMTFTPLVADRLEPYTAQAAVREGAAFVGIFVVTHSVIALVGFVLDRAAGRGVVSRIGGIAVGAGKGGAVLAFVLLFAHLFPLMPKLDAQIMESRLAPPLIGIAGNVIRFGLDSTPSSDTPTHT